MDALLVKLKKAQAVTIDDKTIPTVMDEYNIVTKEYSSLSFVKWDDPVKFFNS